MILKVFPSGPIETNCILIACSRSKQAAVIDVPFDSAQASMQYLQEHGLFLDKILLTHSHWDHIAEVALLKKLSSAPVYVHTEDAGNLERPGSDGLPLLETFDGVRPDHFLNDGQRLSIGDLEIEVLHTPGHTPGCVCFYLAKENTLISGDTLFQGTYGNLSFPTARPQAMRHSLRKLAKFPAETIVYPGHGPRTTIGAEANWMKNI